MRKNELIKLGDKIYRVLAEADNKVMIIDCHKGTMPVWIPVSTLSEAESVGSDAIETVAVDESTLTAKQKQTMQTRYNSIAPILPFVANEVLRTEIIKETARNHGVSEQTVRGLLCKFLIYQTPMVFAPKPTGERKLTEDQKNIRWALNRYYYTPYRNTLADAYVMMLRARYTDESGTLFPHYPSIYQFRYFYKTHRKMQTQYISRNGKSEYYRNHRPLLGEGVIGYCPTVGYGMLDSTVMDIYLRDESGTVIGRPILTLSVCGYSSLIMGYALTMEGGVSSLQELLHNQIENKVEHCRRNGVIITEEDWNCNALCSTYITDRGKEYLSFQIEQLTELGITIKNLEAFHPNDKSRVEQCFNMIQNAYKPYLNGHGVVQKENYMEITGRDYRGESTLTLESFRRIVLECIVFYNARRVMDFPFPDNMITDGVAPHASNIYNWGLRQAGANMISVSPDELTLTMLPRTTAKFTREGLTAHKLRYRAEGYTERYLTGGAVTVAYNPTDISKVWLIEGGYHAFELIESRYKGKTLSETIAAREKQKAMIKEAMPQQLQAKVDLAEKIKTIVAIEKEKRK